MGGLGTPPATPIVALPPIRQLKPALQLDPSTDEPHRHPNIKVAYLTLILAAAAQAAGLGLTWWRAINMDSFPTSCRLIEWASPDPGSPGSIGLAVAIVAIGVVLVAAPALAGYLGWVGRPQAPWWAVGALAVTPATYLLAPSHGVVVWGNIGWLAIPITLVGTIFLWLPQSRQSLGEWQAFRHPAPPDAPPSRVVYGRLDQFK